MKVTFTKKNGETVEETFDTYTVDSTARGTHHDVILHNDGEGDHKDRHRVVSSVDGPSTGAPRYVHAEFEDGRVLGVADAIGISVSSEEIAQAEEDAVLTEEEIDAMTTDVLAEELTKRNVEVPKLKADRADALKKAVGIE